MRWSTSSGHQSGPDLHLTRARRLQAVKRLQQGLEGTRAHGLTGQFPLVLLKRIEALCLKHTLGFIREKNRIPIKRNAHFVGVSI